jgi:LPS sulfotransferase NodH
MTFVQTLPAPEIEITEPAKTILLCSGERTGSHLLARHMATTGVLGRPYEYFNTNGMRFHFPEYPENIPNQFRCAKHLSTTSNRVFALKMDWWSMQCIVPHLRLFDSEELYFVYLSRDDLLGQAISLAKARQTNFWASSRHALALPVAPRYDGDQLVRLLQELVEFRNRWEIYFAKNGIFPLRLTYEAVVEDAQRAVGQIATFVGVPEPAILDSEEFYVFSRQSDSVNIEWRTKFLSQFGNLYDLG